MRSETAAALLLIGAAVVGVRHFESRSAQPAALAQAAAAPAAPAPPAARGDGREVRVAAGANHQYFVTAAVNRRPAAFLVDTGASYVALRDSDARAANIRVAASDFTHPVRTANGDTKAALVDIDAIEIDGIRVEGVRAFVLPDEQLAVNLLGMSFLSQLESVEQRGGELVLKG
jgi:aspartyl protease family protein